MSKEKQIEEIQNIIYLSTDIPRDFSKLIASKIYSVGYHKQSEGEWVKNMNHKECSKCGYNAPYKKIKAGYHLRNLSKYCPNCGAKMKGGE